MKVACKREGIKKEDLIQKTTETIIRMLKDKDPSGNQLWFWKGLLAKEEIVNMVFEHFEEKRRQKIMIVRQQRQKIL